DTRLPERLPGPSALRTAMRIGPGKQEQHWLHQRRKRSPGCQAVIIFSSSYSLTGLYFRFQPATILMAFGMTSSSSFCPVFLSSPMKCMPRCSGCLVLTSPLPGVGEDLFVPAPVV